MVPLPGPTWIDHVLFAGLTFVIPLYAWATYPATKKRLAGSPADRQAEYRATVFWLWGIAGLTLAATGLAGRPLSSLGLPGDMRSRFWIALAVALAIAVYLAYQVALVARHERYRQQVRVQIGDQDVDALIPRSRGEVKMFGLIAISAGVAEEIAYRGFLMPYLAYFVGAAGSLGLASVLFGCAHAYQGVGGMARTGAASLILGGLFLLSGSLVPAMLLHTAVDLQGALLGYLSRVAEKEP